MGLSWLFIGIGLLLLGGLIIYLYDHRTKLKSWFFDELVWSKIAAFGLLFLVVGIVMVINFIWGLFQHK